MEDGKHVQEIAALRAQVEAMRAEVEALRAEVRGARGRLDLTMRGQLRCPACGGRRIAHALEVLDRGESNAREAMAIYQPKWWSGKTRGKLELYACTACGVVEWWVADPAGLEPHDEYLRILDGETGEGGAPYR